MDRLCDKKLSLEALTYMIHHVFLPPKLPNKDDFKAEYDTILLDTTISSLLKFKGCTTQDKIVVVDCVIAMVMNLRAVHDSNGTVNVGKLAACLRNLEEKRGTIPLHIRAQNAGVLISKVNESIHVEVFELSPLNEAVLTTKGRLQRTFPGPALSLNMQVFKQSSFQATVADTLATMSHQRAVGTQPKAKKAGRMHDEDRDTTHPKFVTELFMMGFLRSVGEPVEVSRLLKNTREEVLYLDGRSPWRRSPFWLLIRVAMQLVFTRSSKTLDSAEEMYKSFMLFLMTDIMEKSLEAPLPSDLVYSMNAKVVRRLLKLDRIVDSPELNFTKDISQKANALLEAKWSDTMKKATLDFEISRLKRLDFERDAATSLHQLDLYIRGIAARKNQKGSNTFHPNSNLVEYDADKLPNCLSTWTTEYTPYNLRAFEAWVALHLNSWLADHQTSSNTCASLGELIRIYHGTANLFYSGNPEGTSLMLLTILELWVACDKSATQIYGFLRDYGPGVPKELLESLLLPSKSQMERLLRVEAYVQQRGDRNPYPAPHIFQTFGQASCFSARYFAQSPDHKRLLKDITAQAVHDRRKKQDELREKKSKYDGLMQLYNNSSCEYYDYTNPYTGFCEERHHSYCSKCSYKSQAANLAIRVHEWPLPSDTYEEQCTIFELKVPHSFGHWRDTTLFLLRNVLKNEYVSEDSPRSSHHLHSYNGLSGFFVPFSSKQRVGLLSQIKPHDGTHRRDISISIAIESDVCLNNGLSYEYYDNETSLFVRNLTLTDEIPKACTYKLPLRSSSLQKFVFRPATIPSGPSPNTVIASQSECPDHMSLDEYKGLSSIPLGYRIQWLNLLRELSLPSVDFKKVETGLVTLQSIYQAGLSQHGNVLRESHSILDDETFSSRLLEALHGALQRVKENWEASQALQTFISLAQRLLSLTSTKEVQTGCLAYLSKARIVTFNWVNLIKQKANKVTNGDQRNNLSAKTVRIALTCIDSFNVDERYIDGVLSVPEDATIFLQCAIIIEEGDLTVSKSTESITSLLYSRWKALSHRCYTILGKEILENNTRCLDDAVKRSWSGYQAGCGWRVVSGQCKHWLVTQTAPQGNGDPIWVHFNLLDGQLLVNGIPLARLPAQYEHHPYYSTLFGKSAIEVMPTGVPGMQFSGKEDYAGYTLHFGMTSFTDSFGSSGNDLMIQATSGDRKYELIPSRFLRGHLPTALVDDFVHWYDCHNLSVEFRPRSDPWITSAKNWVLNRPGAGSAWHLTKEGPLLVGVKSETAQVISRILSPLEDSLRIHVTFNPQSSSLDIELPKLRLGFYLNRNGSAIHSKQFRGMSVDPDQSLGTLIGLLDKLILKDERQGNRRVLVPEGPISNEISDGHVCVTINKTSASKCHAYGVDVRLGTLNENEDLQSKLFLCFLHALTSFCLPDPLTHRTGTEQALSILNSAGVRSFTRLTQENVKILEQIARLTPNRTFYPTHERSMQVVKWSPYLGFLAQHGSFYKCVKSIFDEADANGVFHPGLTLLLPKLEETNQHLLDRDCIRSSTFRISGFGAEDHTNTHDEAYSARDRTSISEGGYRAFVMSSVIYLDHAALPFSISSSSDLRTSLWNTLSQTPVIFGLDRQLQSSELKYDGRLFLDGPEFLSKHWTALHHNLIRKHSWIDKFSLMIWLSTLAFSEKADTDALQVVASFFTVPAMAHISIPPMESFELPDGTQAIKNKLRDAIKTALVPFRSCPEAQIPSFTSESRRAHLNRQRQTFQTSQDRTLTDVVNILYSQFPCETPTIHSVSRDLTPYIDMVKVVNAVKPNFKTWFANHMFYEYLGNIGDKLMKQPSSPFDTPSNSFSMPQWDLIRRPGYISIDEIFDRAIPPVLTPSPTNDTNLLSRHEKAEKITLRLTGLLNQLDAQAISKYEQEYVTDLRASMSSLWGQKGKHYLKTESDVKAILSRHLNDCKERCDSIYSAIWCALNSSADGNGSAVASVARQWPRLSPTLFLQQLSRSRWSKISKWQECIVQYGVTITELQRAERLYNSVDNHLELVRELENPGHTNWTPLEYPEALLLEVESGIMIREVQEHIAQQMRDPPSGENAVMQLNMGEGKSSVIMPIVAVALANPSTLVRVIVAKPQAKQMFHMLLSKLGGLLDRRVYQMPFSRELKLGPTEAVAIHNMCQECMRNGGVLLVQPEHVLSFKLMGLESSITGKEEVGRSLLRTQEFFDTSSRDLVDESDENFSVKFELIYTMGSQRPIELSPERWICIQQVLSLVRTFAPLVKMEFSKSMEISERHRGAFPRTRLLRPDAQQDLLTRVAKRICDTGLNGFPIARQPEQIRQTVFKYITERDLTPSDISKVETCGFWTEGTNTTLLLLRGLLAGGVLAFAFGQKRWRVNYGLDSTRTPGTRLAVPYRAKDSPAPRSEFSHPDVVIVLTSLSYYYAALKDDELFLALSHLLKSDQANDEYQDWVIDAPELPTAFQNVSGINLKDENQCIQQVFPHLRHAKAAVDYFLAHIVFPKEMKEFPHKLSASGWDIGQIKALPTTGFSGTNDSRKVLPLSVRHLDLQEQKHTNALVLEYLLQPENTVAIMPSRDVDFSSDTEILMAMVTTMKPAVHVILDVGAQILELTNLMVASKWLEMTPDHSKTQAAVFFDDNHELCVLDRRGRVEHWQTSPFAKQPDLCLVFLDEGHTRGTDIKLPIDYRAAVTLGPNLTKDRLVQACMRLRQLGKGQSVVFCVPEEIKSTILTRSTKKDKMSVDVSDVLNWAILETRIDIGRSLPLWATQGQRFERQDAIWAEARRVGQEHMSQALAETFLENEAQSLEDRYRPRPEVETTSFSPTGQNRNLKLIEERCQEFKDLEFSSSTLQEEQERELSPEIEAERQVQKPPPAKPATHDVHDDFITFVKQGIPVAGSKAYRPAFDTLFDTSAAAYLDVAQFPRDLLVTADFASTIEISGKSYTSDAYQRPVQWVLTSTGSWSGKDENVAKFMMIISPFEAHYLLPEIKDSKTVTLHLYSARPNMGFRALDRLDLYTVPVRPVIPALPRSFIIQLNLFAGQLYFSSYNEYVEVCEVLGLAYEKAENGVVVAADGFIVSQNDSVRPVPRCTFRDSPVNFLKVLMMKIRRNCEGIDKTHMGQMLDGRILLPEYFGDSDGGFCKVEEE